LPLRQGVNFATAITKRYRGSVARAAQDKKRRVVSRVAQMMCFIAFLRAFFYTAAKPTKIMRSVRREKMRSIKKLQHANRLHRIA
jgi:hypothetical protein